MISKHSAIGLRPTCGFEVLGLKSNARGRAAKCPTVMAAKINLFAGRFGTNPDQTCCNDERKGNQLPAIQIRFVCQAENNDLGKGIVNVMGKVIATISAVLLASGLAACAVGPGTPLVDTLRSGRSPNSANVPAPKGYGAYVNAGESSGLVNPEEREATEEYLESLALQ